MSVLTKFLTEEGRVWRSAAMEREAERSNWHTAVTRLLGTIRGWVLGSDADRVLQLVETDVELIESRLGMYKAPALTIAFGARLVHFVPVARYAAGTVPGPDGGRVPAAGCVAVNTTRELTAAAPNYRLYRHAGPAGDRWFVAAEGPADRELTREVFERMLVGLLS